MSFWGALLWCPICITLNLMTVYSPVQYIKKGFYSSIIEMACVQLNIIIQYIALFRILSAVACKSHRSVNAQSNKNKRAGDLDSDIYSIIFGSLLGDAYAERRGNTRIHFHQEESNKQHLFNMWSRFSIAKTCTNTMSKAAQRQDLFTGRMRKVYGFKTYSYADFNWIHSLFYTLDSTNNKLRKVVLLNIADYLTPLALAIWFMDDGKKQGYGYAFSTNSFTESEVVFLCEVLNNKYGLIT